MLLRAPWWSKLRTRSLAESQTSASIVRTRITSAASCPSRTVASMPAPVIWTESSMSSRSVSG